MDFRGKLFSLAEKIEDIRDIVTTEEATKTSFVLPMLSLLGYDVFDPTVVVPEFTADIGRKKGEKADYAIMRDGVPLILIEAKPHTEKLDRHKTQIERYFNATESKFGILTNGIEYRFYSDLDRPNVMDASPFLVFDLTDIKTRDIKQLEKFSAEILDVNSILNMAGREKYIHGIKDVFKSEAENPSDDFVKFFATHLVEKPIRKNILDDFRIYTKQAFSEIVNDLVSDKLNTIKAGLSDEAGSEDPGEEEEKHSDDGIITTNEELQGFFIVKSILAEVIPLERVAARDTKSYFGILLDDNNRKWICRLRFNAATTKYIGIHVGERDEEKFQIEKLNEIYKYKEAIIAAATALDG